MNCKWFDSDICHGVAKRMKERGIPKECWCEGCPFYEVII